MSRPVKVSADVAVVALVRKRRDRVVAVVVVPVMASPEMCAGHHQVVWIV